MNDYHCLIRDAQTLGLPSPVCSPEAVKAAFRRRALSAHPDAGGTVRDFQRLESAKERLLRSRTETARFQDITHSKTDFMDRLNDRLRPGRLVSSNTKLALRLGAFALVLGGALLDSLSSDRRRRRPGRIN
mmetsp:Transcript_19766/g.58815  ORF Transcript_19766/g.58815 Transcript_19766/m.58815 type:complete len:131 (-) Transcript_19766:19-411(-)